MMKIICSILFTGTMFFSASLTANGQQVDFLDLVKTRIGAERFASICDIKNDVVARRVFKDYGAMFIADSSVKYPSNCVFKNEDEVTAYQNSLKISKRNVNGREIELQEAAMDALLKADSVAKRQGLKITPRGATSARRDYAATYRIWKSRFDPALAHWTSRGRIKREDAERAKSLETNAQVAQVMKWEEEEIWFSTRFNYSIFSSVAAPGTSQHLSMIALDVAEFDNARVKAILNDHGWFQTIIDDNPHYTYLGYKEEDLSKYGLIAVTRNGIKFWIPNYDR